MSHLEAGVDSGGRKTTSAYRANEPSATTSVIMYNIVRVSRDQRIEMKLATASAAKGKRVQPMKRIIKNNGALLPIESINQTEPIAPITAADRATKRAVLRILLSGVSRPMSVEISGRLSVFIDSVRTGK